VSSTLLCTIDEDECLALLAADEVGRLGVIHGRGPIVVPVNYVLDGRDVFFRTDPGTKLTAGPRSRACLEIDSFDRSSRTGWSVLAIGRLEEVTQYNSPLWDRVSQVTLRPWAGGSKDHWMHLAVDTVTGRRIVTA